ncbi:DNA annealing helicase and endonuclease ZRANB3-like [Arctopsyche grandis]|uniref:DNA annealing helicase and endonuclease ZRANB3-like n=1 Tax=Arctopsyche grandis TaxID=121162 RepID=UPI00406D649F
MTLKEYQKEGVAFIVKNYLEATTRGMLLHMDPGLGKSLTIIESLKVLKIKNVCVVCPASLKINWLKEIEKWGYLPEKLDIYSFNHCQRHIPKLEKGTVLIVDEAHGLRNWQSKQTRNIIFKIAPQAERVYLLTGTPVVRSFADLHPLFTVLEPQKWGSYSIFAEKFANKEIVFLGKKRIVKYTGYKNSKELKELASGISFGRKKADVLKELPPKSFFEIHIDPNLKVEDKTTKEEINEALNSGVISEALMSMRRISGITKAVGCAEYINTFSEPVVVFCHHKEVAKILENEFKKDGKTVASIVGGDNLESRNLVVENFQDGKVDVVICSIEAAGVGITLTRASICFFVELPFNYASYLQAYGRIDRIGQENHMQIYNFLSSDLDYAIQKIVLSKKDSLVEFEREKA